MVGCQHLSNLIFFEIYRMARPSPEQTSQHTTCDLGEVFSKGEEVHYFQRLDLLCRLVRFEPAVLSRRGRKRLPSKKSNGIASLGCSCVSSECVLVLVVREIRNSHRTILLTKVHGLGG